MTSFTTAEQYAATVRDMPTSGIRSALDATYAAMRSAAGTPAYHDLKSRARTLRAHLHARAGDAEPQLASHGSYDDYAAAVNAHRNGA